MIVKFDDVKKYTKEDDARLYIWIYRRIGLLITWILINLFPEIKANNVTLSMLLFNIISFVSLYFSIICHNLFYLAIYFLVFNLSICLDSVDGNIARINNDKTIFGLYLDRLVHNISHPLLFITIGFALYNLNNRIPFLMLFIVAGIVTELSPLELAKEQVENLFYKQMLNLKKTTQYNIKEYKLIDAYNVNIYNVKIIYLKKVLDLLTLNCLPIWNTLFLSILVDLLLFQEVYIVTTLITIMYVIRNISKSIFNTKLVLAGIQSELIK
jgi:phosphatidylserine synthase